MNKSNVELLMLNQIVLPLSDRMKVDLICPTLTQKMHLLTGLKKYQAVGLVVLQLLIKDKLCSVSEASHHRAVESAFFLLDLYSSKRFFRHTQ